MFADVQLDPLTGAETRTLIGADRSILCSQALAAFKSVRTASLALIRCGSDGRIDHGVSNQSDARLVLLVSWPRIK